MADGPSTGASPDRQGDQLADVAQGTRGSGVTGHGRSVRCNPDRRRSCVMIDEATVRGLNAIGAESVGDQVGCDCGGAGL